MSRAMESRRGAGSWGRNDHPHLPYVRHVRTSWRLDAHRLWVSEPSEDTMWEVICSECGDTEGPAEEQNGAVRELRGPYSNKHKAQRVAHRHERREGVQLRWIPGSTARIPA